MRRFNPERELRKIQHGNKHKIVFSVIALLLIIAIGSSYALYQVRYSKRIIYTKVAPFSSSDLDLAIYVNGEKSTEVPSEEDGYKFVTLLCEKEYNGSVMWDYDNKTLSLLQVHMPIPNKCNLYFINSDYKDYKSFEYNGTDGSDGSVQEYNVPKNGLYRIELWGAAGGNTTLSGYVSSGGKGAYVSGIIKLQKDDKLYFFVGGKGQNGQNVIQSVTIKGGYNGGGSVAADSRAPAGGGATDVRLVSGTWDNFDSLKSRIMVAGAGGGGGINNPGAPGGLNGGIAGNYYGYNGSQNSGGAPFSGNVTHLGKAGGFGFGGWGNGAVAGAGGSGYYGGASASHLTPSTSGGGGGGSSFISGHLGCNAIDNEKSIDTNNIVHTGNSEHYSGKVFTNTFMIDGEGYYWTDTRQTYIGMPTFNGNGAMDGNTDNGYAKITYLGS